MPEKVRRIYRKNTRKSSRQKRWVFFILLIVLIVGGIVILNKPHTPEAKKVQRIEDRNFVAAVCAQTRCVAVNKDAVAFEHISRPSGSILFRIDVPEQTESIEVGEAVIRTTILKELLFLRKQLKESINVHITTAATLSYDQEDFDIQTQEGWVLKISTYNNAHITAEVLRRTLTEIGERRAGLDYIDLRIPNRVYYAFK